MTKPLYRLAGSLLNPTILMLACLSSMDIEKKGNLLLWLEKERDEIFKYFPLLLSWEPHYKKTYIETKAFFNTYSTKQSLKQFRNLESEVLNFEYNQT